MSPARAAGAAAAFPAIAGAVFLGLTLLGPRTIPSYFPDAGVTLWSFGHMRGWLTGESDRLYHTGALFAPGGTSLLLHNLTEAVCLPAAAVAGWAGPFAAYRAAVAGVTAANFLSARRLFLTLSGGHVAGSTAAAAAVSIHPFLLGHLAGGHLNLYPLFPYFWLVGSAVAPARGSFRADAAALAPAAAAPAVAAYTDLYLLYFLSLSLPAAAVVRARVVGEWKRLVAAACLGLLVGAPKWAAVAATAGSGSYTRNHDPSEHGLDASSFVTPRSSLVASLLGAAGDAGEPLNRAESGGYLGVSFVAAALVALLRPRRDGRDGSLVTDRAATDRAATDRAAAPLAAAAFVFAALSLGPTVRAGGADLFGSPLYRAASVLPFFPTVPARFAAPALACLSAAAACGLRRFPKRGAVFPAWCVLLAAEFLPAPPLTKTFPRYAELRVLAAEPAARLAIDLGTPEDATYRQSVHRVPVTGGFVARRPRAAVRAARGDPFARYVTTGRGDAGAAAAALARSGADLVIAEEWQLRRVEEVLLHAGPCRGAGRPVASDGVTAVRIACGPDFRLAS